MNPDMLVSSDKIEVVTMQASQDVRQVLHHLADELPESATWNDVLEKVRFRQAVERGIQAANRSEFATEDQVRNAFARWGVDADS